MVKINLCLLTLPVCPDDCVWQLRIDWAVDKNAARDLVPLGQSIKICNMTAGMILVRNGYLTGNSNMALDLGAGSRLMV